MVDTPLRQCSKKQNCIHPDQIDGGWLPATSQYFNRWIKGKDGLNCSCRVCHAQETKTWRLENLERERAKHRERDRNRKYTASPEALERRKERQRIYNARKKAERAAKRLQNPTQKQLRASSKRIQNTQSQQTSAIAKRRQQAAALADNWERCMHYWNDCCVYCGAQRSFWHVIEVEHFIPRTAPDCPGDTPTNLIPACKSCNASKGDRAAAEWAEWKFGKRKAKQILAKINAYFGWVKAQNP